MDRESMQQRFGIIGTSAGVRQALDRVRQVAETKITVLIQGESGVGKELFAHALHDLSSRRHKTMLIVNCGAIPEGLIESELFGNEKGAYTGAVEKRSGYFEEADGSTIFLDEIGEMPLTAQVRLLRVLETGEFSRVGSSAVLNSDVRVIAATNKDLAREVERGRFREDLYYRLSTVILRVPPLRERREDIMALFEHFQHRFAQKYDSSSPRLEAGAKELLLKYRWPGNIRELRNVAEQSVVLMRQESLTSEDLRPYLRGVSASGSGVGLVRVSDSGEAETDGVGTRERELVYRALMELRTEVRDMKEQIAALLDRVRGAGYSEERERGTDYGGRLLVMRGSRDRTESPDEESSFIEDIPYELEASILEEEDRNSGLARASSRSGAGSDEAKSSGAASGPGQRSTGAGKETGNGSRREGDHDNNDIPTLEDAEKSLITTALERFEGNRRKTAEALGISERTLYRKLKEMDSEN